MKHAVLLAAHVVGLYDEPAPELVEFLHAGIRIGAKTIYLPGCE